MVVIQTTTCGGVEVNVRTGMDSAEGDIGILQIRLPIGSNGAIIPPARALAPTSGEPLLASGDLQHNSLVNSACLRLLWSTKSGACSC